MVSVVKMSESMALIYFRSLIQVEDFTLSVCVCDWFCWPLVQSGLKSASHGDGFMFMFMFMNVSPLAPSFNDSVSIRLTFIEMCAISCRS